MSAIEPAYLEAIQTPGLGLDEGILAALEPLDREGLPDDPWDDPNDLGDADDDYASPPASEIILDILRRAVGGDAALHDLDDAPLPDFELDFDEIAADIRARVEQVLALCDGCCEEVLDLECRTACRCFIGLLARTGPEVFRRQGRNETAAGAICWIVAKTNAFATSSGRRPLVRDIAGHFGLASGSVSQQASTMLKTAGLAPDSV